MGVIKNAAENTGAGLWGAIKGAVKWWLGGLAATALVLGSVAGIAVGMLVAGPLGIAAAVTLGIVAGGVTSLLTAFAGAFIPALAAGPGGIVATIGAIFGGARGVGKSVKNHKDEKEASVRNERDSLETQILVEQMAMEQQMGGFAAKEDARRAALLAATQQPSTGRR